MARDDELWSWRQVSQAFGGDKPVSHNSIRRWVEIGILSPPITLGPATVRWYAREVRADIKRRARSKGWDKGKGKAPMLETRSD
jgi:hypothetical protein